MLLIMEGKGEGNPYLLGGLKVPGCFSCGLIKKGEGVWQLHPLWIHPYRASLPFMLQHVHHSINVTYRVCLNGTFPAIAHDICQGPLWQ